MNYTNGLVSVVIPTYKRSETLSRAIVSVLNQSYEKIEVLVVNDNVSPDDEYSRRLYEIIGGIQDDRLRLISQKNHINGAAARNAGIREAKGEFIAFLDDDDYWEDGKIDAQIKQFRKLSDDWGMVTCLNILRKNDKIVGASLPYKDGEIFLDVLERRIGIGTGAALIRRTALDRAGYFDESLNRHQDLQLFANLTFRYKTKLVRQYLHNIDIEDGQNRPDAGKLKEIKDKYYHSISDLLETLNTSQRNRVYIMNDFEIAYALIKGKEYSKGVKMGMEVFRTPMTLYLSIERILRKTCEKKMKDILLRRFHHHE